MGAASTGQWNHGRLVTGMAAAGEQGKVHGGSLGKNTAWL
jgi:hypothetical protein